MINSNVEGSVHDLSQNAPGMTEKTGINSSHNFEHCNLISGAPEPVLIYFLVALLLHTFGPRVKKFHDSIRTKYVDLGSISHSSMVSFHDRCSFQGNIMQAVFMVMPDTLIDKPLYLNT